MTDPRETIWRLEAGNARFVADGVELNRRSQLLGDAVAAKRPSVVPAYNELSSDKVTFS